jgi:hypothetical protein
LEFVLAFLPWDLGCALFVVFISGLCAIKSMPPGPRKLFGTITEIFQTQLRWIARELKGEYLVVFLAEELLYKYIYVY